MADKPRPGRGRLSSIDLLPREVDDIIAWAADELGNRDRTQFDIYQEFVQKLEERMAEFHGELEVEIPGLRSFNRHAVRLSRMSRMLDETREIASVLAAKFDPQKSDDMTVTTAETIKALVLYMINAGAAKGEINLATSKNVMELASAFRSAQQAQGVSSDRRRKAEAEFKAKVQEAVTTVAKAKGLSAETVEAIQAQVLGVST